MLMEGVPPAMIDNAARMAGMPVGPLALNDEVGVDLSWKILQAAKKDLGPQAVDADQEKLIEAMVVKEQRFGRKNGKGFYDYPAAGAKTLWPGLAKIAGKALDPDAIDVQELKDRFLYTAALEAARCIEEGIVTDPREADLGSILGFGFAPFTGGVLSLIDGIGAKAFVARAEALAAKHGKRFAPSAGLQGDGGEGRDLLRPRGRQGGGVGRPFSPLRGEKVRMRGWVIVRDDGASRQAPHPASPRKRGEAERTQSFDGRW